MNTDLRFSKLKFESALENLYKNELIPAIDSGLCGTVYTQLSDVEDETNGFITYDRRVVKVDKKLMHSFSDELLKKFDAQFN